MSDERPGLRFAQALPTFGLTALIAAGIWWAVWRWMAPVAGMEEPVARLLYAVRWAAVALTFTLFLGVEAVAHERLFTRAFDPLIGAESRRMRINARYLQNTLEQSVLFVAALLAMSFYLETASSMRAIAAATIVWTVARWAFWIGYHIAPRHRLWGIIGLVQTQAMLVYVSARFGADLAGSLGAWIVGIAYGAAELALVLIVRRPDQNSRVSS